MKVKWFGHSFFEITSISGVKIATDPFDKSIGYNVPEIKANIVTVSHDHYDHNKINSIHGKFECFIEAGNYQYEDVQIRGVLSNHGLWFGENIIFRFLIDDMFVCHCGDLGTQLSQEQIKELGHVDILLIPVGGGGQVLNTKGAIELIQKLNPKVVIPMHYKTEKLNWKFFMLNNINNFLNLTKGVRINSQEIEINKENIKELEGTIVLNYE